MKINTTLLGFISLFLFTSLVARSESFYAEKSSISQTREVGHQFGELSSITEGNNNSGTFDFSGHDGRKNVSAMNLSFDESDLIAEPQGEKIETVRTSTVFYKLGGTTIYTGDDTGAVGDYVKGDDGNLYMLCVVGGNSTLNYLKLEQAGDSRYVAKMPQLVMVEEYDGVKYGYFASRMEKEEIAENPDSISYIISNDKANELYFTLGEDGTLSIEQQDNVILGLTYSDGVWTGYGDVGIRDAVVALQKNVLPEGAELEKWQFEYQWANWPEHGVIKSYIDVAVSDSEIYINNPYNKAQDQWIKGTIEGDKVSFEACQLLGQDDETNRYLYFRVGELTKNISGYYTYADAERLVFDYDVDNQTLTTEDPVSMYISRGYGQRGYNVNYDFPQLSAYSENITGLMDPSFTFFAPDDMFGSYGYSYIQVQIPATDIDGNSLNVDNLYYSIYVGESDEPFVFSAETYYNDFKEDVTEIPYNYEGYDIYSYSAGSDLRNIFFYFSTANVNLGVQSIYYAADGTVYKSNIVRDSSSSVESVEVTDDYLRPWMIDDEDAVIL